MLALGARKRTERFLQATRLEVLRTLTGVSFSTAEKLRREEQHECGANHAAAPGANDARRRPDGPAHAATAIASTASPVGIQNRSR